MVDRARAELRITRLEARIQELERERQLLRPEALRAEDLARRLRSTEQQGIEWKTALEASQRAYETVLLRKKQAEQRETAACEAKKSLEAEVEALQELVGEMEDKVRKETQDRQRRKEKERERGEKMYQDMKRKQCGRQSQSPTRDSSRYYEREKNHDDEEEDQENEYENEDNNENSGLYRDNGLSFSRSTQGRLGDIRLSRRNDELSRLVAEKDQLIARLLREKEAVEELFDHQLVEEDNYRYRNQIQDRNQNQNQNQNQNLSRHGTIYPTTAVRRSENLSHTSHDSISDLGETDASPTLFRLSDLAALTRDVVEKAVLEKQAEAYALRRAARAAQRTLLRTQMTVEELRRKTAELAREMNDREAENERAIALLGTELVGARRQIKTLRFEMNRLQVLMENEKGTTKKSDEKDIQNKENNVGNVHNIEMGTSEHSGRHVRHVHNQL